MNIHINITVLVYSTTVMSISHKMGCKRSKITLNKFLVHALFDEHQGQRRGLLKTILLQLVTFLHMGTIGTNV